MITSVLSEIFLQRLGILYYLQVTLKTKFEINLNNLIVSSFIEEYWEYLFTFFASVLQTTVHKNKQIYYIQHVIDYT